MTANIGAPRISLRLLLLAGTMLSATSASFIAPANAGNPPFVFDPGTLVISSSTYDRTQGAVKNLMVGSSLPGQSVANSNGNYVTVWNNASQDGSFGVTSEIELTDVNPSTGLVLHSGVVPTNQVVTSFSSKSELGLHITPDWPNPRLTFVGYSSPGVGALDVSNSDAVAGQDPTNPVTAFYGNSYAFSRTIVSIDTEGNIAYTPTINYGGNNGRSALFSETTGLYYTVGNANNGNAATFGSTCKNPPDLTTSTSNCTSPDVTETTGVEVVTPIDAMFLPAAIPAGNSAEVDPLLEFACGKNGAPDKAGKDDNFRGITEYGGALYFTKGSGSNGYDTVYTISNPAEPTVATASGATISIVPGFPNDCARTTGGNYTPFAVFFANSTTMYVSDEGSGNATDTATHAGLEKWSLVDGTWQLDYVLTNGLIGKVDAGLTGADGAWPNVTTVGLRNLTGVVNGNGNGTVTLWATTSTLSTSGDNGADPNKVVMITDKLDATTMTNQVKGESFVTVVGPTYGKVYRGVAYVETQGQLKH